MATLRSICQRGWRNVCSTIFLRNSLRSTSLDISTPLQRLKVEKTTGRQSVRGRGGVIAVMYETHWTGLSRPSWEQEMNLQLSRTKYCATGPALRTSTAKTTVCTAGCELVLHKRNFLGVTASAFRRPATTAFRAQNGLAAAAPRCFPTEPILRRGIFGVLLG